MSDSPLDNCRDFLSDRGQRLTRENVAVFEAICGYESLFDAGELVELLQTADRDTRVSRSTVYRTLLDLEQAGIVREIRRSGDTQYLRLQHQA